LFKLPREADSASFSEFTCIVWLSEKRPTHFVLVWRVLLAATVQTGRGLV
jgi:hypothetical protein